MNDNFLEKNKDKVNQVDEIERIFDKDKSFDKLVSSLLDFDWPDYLKTNFCANLKNESNRQFFNNVLKEWKFLWSQISLILFIKKPDK